MSVTVEAHGFAELDRTLKELEPHVQRKIARRALKRAMEPVLADAKNSVPVDTGKLRDGLKIKSSGPRRKTPHRQTAKVATPTRAALDIAPEETGYYPAVIEYGSDNRQLAPNPYLRPALAKNRNRAVDTLRDELAAGIKTKFRRRFRAKKGLSFDKLVNELK